MSKTSAARADLRTLRERAAWGGCGAVRLYERDDGLPPMPGPVDAGIH
jgi:hypothetical protein